MPAFRALSMLLMPLWLCGCTLSSSDAPQARAEPAQQDKIQIYFSGQTPPSWQFSKRIGGATGQSCQTALFEFASEEAALQSLRSNAAAQNAAAVVNVTCTGTSFSISQPCWPGFICSGEAMQ